MLKVTVSQGDDLFFQIDGDSALAPMDEGERAKVFQALCNAMALIAGVTPPASDAKAFETDGRFSSISQCPADQSCGNVVRLEARRGIQGDAPNC